jgi:hypothetical protein
MNLVIIYLLVSAVPGACVRKVTALTTDAVRLVAALPIEEAVLPLSSEASWVV